MIIWAAALDFICCCFVVMSSGFVEQFSSWSLQWPHNATIKQMFPLQFSVSQILLPETQFLTFSSAFMRTWNVSYAVLKVKKPQFHWAELEDHWQVRSSSRSEKTAAWTYRCTHQCWSFHLCSCRCLQWFPGKRKTPWGLSSLKMICGQPDVGSSSAESADQKCICLWGLGAAHLNYYVFHVIKLLRMKEGGELAPRGNPVSISVSCLETSFVSGKHGFISGLVFYVIKVLSCKESRDLVLMQECRTQSHRGQDPKHTLGQTGWHLLNTLILHY